MLRNGDVPGEGYAINFFLNEEVDPMKVPDAMSYVPGMRVQHTIFASLRTDKSIYQSLLAAYMMARKAVAANMTGRGTGWRLRCD